MKEKTLFGLSSLLFIASVVFYVFIQKNVALWNMIGFGATLFAAVSILTVLCRHECKNWFQTGSILLGVVFVFASIALGIRTGMMNESLWMGLKAGGGLLSGAALFIVGVTRFYKSKEKPIKRILFGVSLLGVAILGLSLASMAISDIFSLGLSSSVTEWGLKIGGGMFVAPIIMVIGYHAIKALILFIDKHKLLSAITGAMMVAVGVSEYLITDNWEYAFGSAFAFLFFWACFCMFIYAWNGVKNEEGVVYWRIGFVFALGFLGSGLLNLLSELLVNVPVLHTSLHWVAYHVGLPAMYGLIGYVLLFFVGYSIAQGWPKLVNWAK